MDYRDKSIISMRYNEGLYDIFLATRAQRLANHEEFIKHKRNAGEAISQTLEWALKHHLDMHLSEREKFYFKKEQNIRMLIEKYISADGSPGDYFYETISEIDPTVDFAFLLKNKYLLTNQAKHHGGEPDLEVQKKYIQQLKNFIHEYLDPSIRLKSIEDYAQANIPTWDLLYSACDRFNTEERNLILIIGPNQNIDAHNLQNLLLPKWKLIIDFDYNSEKEGIYNVGYKTNANAHPHRFKAADFVTANAFSPYFQAHYHFFANNFSGSGEAVAENFNEWNRQYGRKTDAFLKSFSEVFSNQKNIVLILFNSRRYINFLCEKIELHFGDNTVFVFGNDLEDKLTQVCEDFGGIKVDISLPQICEGLGEFSSNFGTQNAPSGKYLIPYMEQSETKTSGELSAEEFSSLEECFEVVHKGLPGSIESDEQRMSFLSGESKISWFGLRNRFDVERQNFLRKYIKPVEKVIDNSRGKVNLVHEAGFGGTTVARRIAWHFHDEYPTLILKKYREGKARELLIYLHQKTRKTIFVVMEVPQTITLDDVEALYKSIPPARPIVFLIVKRGKILSSNDLAVSDWGNDVIDLINAYRPYLKILYSDQGLIEKKEAQYEDVINSNDSYKKTPFYIGLITLEERFYAIKDYIRTFVLEVLEKKEQKKILTYLAICDDYLGQGLPSSFFRTLLKVPKKEIIILQNYFSTDSGIIGSLLVSEEEGYHKIWKIKHSFFSKELKHQLLSGASENPELWKHSLAEACVDFIWDSVSDGNLSEYTHEILQKLFIGNRKDRAGTDFTLIINDIPSLDGKERIFTALKDSYPDNAHYCSHLARFYAYHNKNRDKALQYADEAIRLSEFSGNQDPLLYHIKGMCLRSIAYDAIERNMTSKRNGTPINEEAHDEVVDKLISQTEKQFELSREISKKQNRIDEHGYIAHIQLLTRAIDYCIAYSGKTKAEFFQQDLNPFSEWLDTAESLLEEVKRIKADDDASGKIEECGNSILEFYENYEQILQNLRNRLTRGSNPSRTRRQIVRTYFRKKANYHKDSRTINDIMALMELNIENEPDNEKNFYLWFQAARHSNLSVDEATGRFAKWKANSTAIDSVLYFYIIQVIRALQGYSESAIEASKLIKECRQKGKSNIVIQEWLGKGHGLKKLINRNALSEENKDEELDLVDGYFTEYYHDGSGRITIADRLEVFFSPTQAKMTSADVNKPVQFYLGFSYDGLRADSSSVRIKGQVPRNSDSSNFSTVDPKNKLQAKGQTTQS